MSHTRSLLLALTALATLAATSLSPLPVAAADPEPVVPTADLIDALDELLARMEGEIEAQIDEVGVVPVAGDELDEVFGPLLDDLGTARRFLATWLVPTAQSGGSSRAELYLEGALWTLLGPDDALDHPDLDPEVRRALRASDVPGLGLDLLVGAGDEAAPSDVDLVVELDGARGAFVVDLRFELGQGLDLVVPASFDLGLSVDDADTAAFVPNFGVDMALHRGLDVALEWRALVHLGVEVPLGGGSSAIGPYLQGGTGLRASATVGIAPGPGGSSGFDGRVALGLLQAEFSDGVVREDGGAVERTTLSVEASVDVAGDDRVPVSTLRPDSLAASLSVDGQIRIQARAGVDHLSDALNSAVDAGEFVVGVPSLDFSIIADPSVSVGVGSGGRTADVALDEIRFENITLDMREFLQGVMVPMARNAARLTEPVNEALGLDALSEADRTGILNEPLPVISELAGEDQTLRSLGLDEEFDDLVEVLGALSDFGDDVATYLESDQFADDIGNGGRLPLPCLTVVVEAKSVLNVSKIKRPALCIERNIESELADFDPMVEVDISIAPSVFSFDLLSVESFYSLLLGEPVDIVSIGLPEVEASATATPSVDLEVIEIDIDASAHAEVGLRLAYDTVGLAALVDQLQSGQELDLSVLADGFHVETRPGDCATAAELALPLAQRSRGCEVGVGAAFKGRLQLGPDEANAWGEVDIAGDLGLNVIDPDDDGQLRGRELSALTNDWADPENLFCLFDLRGAGRLYAAAGVVSPVGDSTTELPNVAGEFSLLELLSAEFEVCQGPTAPSAQAAQPILAGVSSGSAGDTLVVHTGEFAALRRAGDMVDDEPLTIEVSGDPSTQLTVRLRTQFGDGVAANAVDLTQSFAGDFSDVVVSGGPEADTITISSNVAALVRSGGGDDQVTTGSGADSVDGGDGGDQITTGAGDDTVDGGDGDDVISTGDGADVARGGPGADAIDGGADSDLVSGGAGGDRSLDGGAGRDTIDGGAGDDTIDGGAGDDTIDGGTGDDDVDGGPGDDVVDAGLGDDAVFGGGGGDRVSSGSGDDFVAVDANRFEGRACVAAVDAESPGDDIVDAGAGDDIVVLGAGNDDVDGGIGNDCVVSARGSDTVELGGGELDTVTLVDVAVIRGAEGHDGVIGVGDDVARDGDRVEGRGAERIELVGRSTLVDDLNAPTAIDGSGLLDLQLAETDVPLSVSASRINLSATRAGTEVRFEPGAAQRVQVLGFGADAVDLPASAALRFIGTTGPDRVHVASGVDVDVDAGEGADRITLVARGATAVRSVVDGGPGTDALTLDLGSDPAVAIGTFIAPLIAVETVEVTATSGGDGFGWNDGVLTFDGASVVDLGGAEALILPTGLDLVTVDAADAGGRGVEIDGDRVTVRGARSIPVYQPVDPASFNAGDEIAIARATGVLEVYRSRAGAEKLGQVAFDSDGLTAVVAADVNSGDLDEVFAFGPSVLNIHGELFNPRFSARFGPYNNDFGQWFAPTPVADGSGRDGVAVLNRNGNDSYCLVEYIRSPGGPFNPGEWDVYGCPNDPRGFAPNGDNVRLVGSRLAGDIAVHERNGNASSVRFLTLGPSTPPGTGTWTLAAEGPSFTSFGFAGPTTGVSCAQGERFAVASARDRNELLRGKISNGNAVFTAAGGAPAPIVALQEINTTELLVVLDNGEVHLDDFCTRSGAGNPVDTGLVVGADDHVFAANLFPDTPAPVADVSSEPNTTVAPVVITAPDATAFAVTTGDAVDSFRVADTNADLRLDSGGGGDHVTLDLTGRPGQQILVETGQGSDHVAARITGSTAGVGIDTGADGDRIELFDNPEAGGSFLTGGGSDDLLRVHPEQRTVRFASSGTRVPGVPADSVSFDGRRAVGYSSFEQVLINDGPVVVLDAPERVDEYTSISLDAGSSFSPDGRPVTFSWDLDGDGVFGDGVGAEQAVVGLDDGTYEFAVRVIDDAGRSSERSTLVAVDVVAPQAVSFVPITSVTTGEAVPVIADVEGGADLDVVQSYEVDWGDGGPSEHFAPGSLEHVYNTAGRYQVRVLTVTDDDGTFPLDSFPTVVEVRDPVLTVSSAPSGSEDLDHEVRFDGSASPIAVDRWLVAWNDGTSDVVTGPEPILRRRFDGPALLTAQVTAVLAGGIEVAVDPFQVAIDDVAPIFTGSVPASADEGWVRIDLSVEDPGQDQVRAWTIDWGDGSASELPAATASTRHRFRPGSYDVLVSVSDDDGTHRVFEQTLEIRNTAPEIVAVSTTDGVEGGAVQLTVDATDAGRGDLVYDLSAPDATDPAVTTLDGTASLTFADDGFYPVTVVVTDAFGLSAETAVEVIVANAAPMASIRLAGTTGRILEGQQIEVAIDTVDRGADTATEATVDWGDGSTPETVTLDAAGRGTASHRFPDGGADIRRAQPVGTGFELDGIVTNADAFVVDGTPFTISLVDVTDEDGTHEIGDVVETEVVDVPPTASARIATVGTERRLTVLAVADPGQDTIVEHRIDWGDGTIDTHPGAPAPGTVFNHEVADASAITLALVDEDGSHIAAVFNVADVNASPGTLEVRAKGSEGSERMVVDVGSTSVEFDVTAEYAVYSVPLDGIDPAAPGPVKVSFVNDRYHPGVIDRNLIVDHIAIGDVVYETEADTVHSTGHYVRGQGCRGRFARTETLHCNGDFLFDLGGAPEPASVVIEVVARGTTGDERMVVFAGDESVVHDVTAEFDRYSLVLDGVDAATLSTVAVAFVNDRFVPGIVDRNLVVDRIIIGDRVFQTEAASTRSTGTYSRGLRCRAGFARSEYLHCNGRFTFDLR